MSAGRKVITFYIVTKKYIRFYFFFYEFEFLLYTLASNYNI